MVLLLVRVEENAWREMAFRRRTIFVAGSGQKIIEQILRSYGTGRATYVAAAFDLLSGNAQPFGRFLMLILLAAEPGLEAIEIEIDHRRREQGQELAQRQEG